MRGFVLPLVLVALSFQAVLRGAEPAGLELRGIAVTPHVRAPRMKFSTNSRDELGARVDLVLENTSDAPLEIESITFAGKTPDELRQEGEWAWHGFPQDDAKESLPPKSKAVWTFNGRSGRWGVGNKHEMVVATDRGVITIPLAIESPDAWISTLTYLGFDDAIVEPSRIICHIRNGSKEPLTFSSMSLSVPSVPARWSIFDRSVEFTHERILPSAGIIPPGDVGILIGSRRQLPLTYGLVEIELRDSVGRLRRLVARTRIRRESFDISGGWVGSKTAVGNSLTYEPFLKTLKRMHVNTAHISDTPGYSDQTGPDGLYTRYPLKYFSALQPIEQFDTDVMLPRIHAAEFLGEPQYPNPEDRETPQEVFSAMLPYASTRIPTSVTLSDESTWRYYAGLSDFPHYDAYRVVAPHVDAWPAYDRWNGKKILWGSPLETIGDMCRSLREMSRPAPTAYWAQGPHDGWLGFDGRPRRSPTADEIRLQAYHALASRITSLYWFNLSPKSIVKYRDTIDELTRIGREIELLEQFYLEGSAYEFRTQPDADGFGWDLASIVGPNAALLFALDLDYQINPKLRVFEFKPPRNLDVTYAIPTFLRPVQMVLRVDADGIQPVTFAETKTGIRIQDQAAKVAVYVVSKQPGLQDELVRMRDLLHAQEEAIGFDPAHQDADFAKLRMMIDR